ncbi:MAG: PEP/pyruvate-binding domain-containing protein [Candidatus Omnitrophica bacterium]|nr:PEP/pyruvate-binding domain-containing protein [Candidatus Omnitrophota bacterium]
MGIPFAILAVLNRMLPGMPMLNVAIFAAALVVFGTLFLAGHMLGMRAPPEARGRNILVKAMSIYRSLTPTERIRIFSVPLRIFIKGAIIAAISVTLSLSVPAVIGAAGQGILSAALPVLAHPVTAIGAGIAVHFAENLRVSRWYREVGMEEETDQRLLSVLDEVIEAARQNSLISAEMPDKPGAQVRPLGVSAALVDGQGNIVELASQSMPSEFYEATGKKYDHAEINTLRAAEKSGHTDWADYTLVVSLEPCDECAKAIMARGIKKVVVATADPTSFIRTEGVRALLSAGIEVTIADEGRQRDALEHIVQGLTRNDPSYLTGDPVAETIAAVSRPIMVREQGRTPAALKAEALTYLGRENNSEITHYSRHHQYEFERVVRELLAGTALSGERGVLQVCVINADVFDPSLGLDKYSNIRMPGNSIRWALQGAAPNRPLKVVIAGAPRNRILVINDIKNSGLALDDVYVLEGLGKGEKVELVPAAEARNAFFSKEEGPRDIMLMGPEEIMGDLPEDIREHTLREVKYAVRIAEEMGLSANDIELIKRAVWAHDVASAGKFEYPTELAAINEGFHRIDREDRAEPVSQYLEKWIRDISPKYGVPAPAVEEAIRKAQAGDYYPIWELYITYAVLGKTSLTDNEKAVARNTFSHGTGSVEKLRDAGVSMPEELEFVVKYHHDYGALDRTLGNMTLKGVMTREKADHIRMLTSLLIVSDSFEQGNNYLRLVEMKGKPRVENFGETVGGWIRHRFNVMERIGERSALQALERLLASKDHKLLSVVREARRSDELMPEDIAFMEGLRPDAAKPITAVDREEIFAMYKGDYVRNHAHRVARIAELLMSEMGIVTKDPGLATEVLAAVVGHDFGGAGTPLGPTRVNQLTESLLAKGVELPVGTSRDETWYARTRDSLFTAPEGTFTPLEMEFALDIFQGPNSLYELRSRNVEVSRPVEVAILFHHHIGELEMYLEEKDWPEAEKERIRMITSILVASDTIENGMNLFKKIFFRDTYVTETPEETMEWLDPAKSGIIKTEVVEAYSSLVSKDPEEFAKAREDASIVSVTELGNLADVGKKEKYDRVKGLVRTAYYPASGMDQDRTTVLKAIQENPELDTVVLADLYAFSALASAEEAIRAADEGRFRSLPPGQKVPISSSEERIEIEFTPNVAPDRRIRVVLYKVDATGFIPDEISRSEGAGLYIIKLPGTSGLMSTGIDLYGSVLSGMRIGDRVSVAEARQPVEYISPASVGLTHISGPRWQRKSDHLQDERFKKPAVFMKTREPGREKIDAALIRDQRRGAAETAPSIFEMKEDIKPALDEKMAATHQVARRHFAELTRKMMLEGRRPVIVSDLDGTITLSNRPIPVGNIMSIISALKAGVPVFIISGISKRRIDKQLLGPLMEFIAPGEEILFNNLFVGSDNGTQMYKYEPESRRFECFYANDMRDDLGAGVYETLASDILPSFIRTVGVHEVAMKAVRAIKWAALRGWLYRHFMWRFDGVRGMLFGVMGKELTDAEWDRFVPGSIDPRGVDGKTTQLTWMVLGREATTEEKLKFQKRGGEEIRRRYEREFEKALQKAGMYIDAKVSGLSSIDISLLDKGRGIQKFSELMGIDADNMIFFGDAFHPEDNDESAIGAVDNVVNVGSRVDIKRSLYYALNAGERQRQFIQLPNSGPEGFGMLVDDLSSAYMELSRNMLRHMRGVFPGVHSMLEREKKGDFDGAEAIAKKEVKYLGSILSREEINDIPGFVSMITDQRRTGRAFMVDDNVLARVLRIMQIVYYSRNPVTTDLNLVRYAWGGPANRIMLGLKAPAPGQNDVAEVWNNSTVMKGGREDNPSLIPGTQITVGDVELSPMSLRELVRRGDDVLGNAHYEKPFFVKFLCTRFADKVHMGFNDRIKDVGRERFVQWLVEERKNAGDIQWSLRTNITAEEFNEYLAVYEEWVLVEADAKWTLPSSHPEVAPIILKMERFFRVGTNLSGLMERTARNRADIVSVMNEIELKEGHVVLSPAGYPHAIFGLSHQTHPTSVITHEDGTKEYPKNEAWIVVKVYGENGKEYLVSVEPQQMSNDTYSFADFYTPIVWDEATGRPKMRKNVTSDDIRSYVENGLYTDRSTTPQDFMREPRDITPGSGARKAKIESLIEERSPVWPTQYFIVHRMSFDGQIDSLASLDIPATPRKFHELLVTKGEIVLKRKSRPDITLSAGETVFMPAGSGEYRLVSSYDAEVLRFFPAEGSYGDIEGAVREEAGEEDEREEYARGLRAEKEKWADQVRKLYILTQAGVAFPADAAERELMLKAGTYGYITQLEDVTALGEFARFKIASLHDNELRQVTFSDAEYNAMWMQNGLRADRGNGSYAVMMFKMGISEKLRADIIAYLESKGFDVARVGGQGAVDMTTMLKRWGEGSGIGHSVKDIARDGVDTREAEAALKTNDGKRFMEWFSGLSEDQRKLDSVRMLEYSMNCLSRGIEMVILRSRISRRQLVKEFGQEDVIPDRELISAPFQDIFKKIVVGDTHAFKAGEMTLRGRFIRPALSDAGEMSELYDMGKKYVKEEEIGLIANGVHCPKAGEELGKEINDYLQLPQKALSVAASGRHRPTATISGLRGAFGRGQAFGTYAVRTAPFVEEGLFFFLPALIGYVLDNCFATGGLATLMSIISARMVFLALHGKEGMAQRVPVQVALFGAMLSLPVAAVLPVGMLPVTAIATILMATAISAGYHAVSNKAALVSGEAPAVIEEPSPREEGPGALPDDELTRKVLGGLVKVIPVFKPAIDGTLTLDKYMSFNEDMAVADVREGLHALVDRGLLSVSTGAEGEETYKLTSAGTAMVPLVWSANISDWLERVKETTGNERARVLDEIREPSMLKLYPGADSMDKERMGVLNDHRREVLDTIFSCLTEEIGAYDPDAQYSMYRIDPLLNVITQMLNMAGRLGEEDLSMDIVERIIGLPYSRHADLQARMQQFNMSIISSYPEKARTLVFNLLAGFLENGNQVVETNNPLFSLVVFLHNSGSENFYYFLRRVCGFYFVDNSGQVNIGPDHDLRRRTRNGDYGIDINGVIRDSIHNNLGVYVLGLLERMLEYYQTGNRDVLGDPNFQVDAFRDDVVPSMDAVFPQDTLDRRKDHDIKSDMWHKAVERVFYYLDGDFGRELGVTGRNKFDKLRKISDEDLQKIYDRVNNDLRGDPNFVHELQVEEHSWGLSGYFYAYRELSRRYKRINTKKALTREFGIVADQYSSVRDVMRDVGVEDVFGFGQSALSRELAAGDPMMALGKVLALKKAIKNRIFDPALPYDLDELFDRYNHDWGRDDIGNAYGGAWVLDDRLGLYMADNVLTMLTAKYIEELSARYVFVNDVNVKDVLRYISVLSEISNVEGLMPRSFKDHIDTLLNERDIDSGVVRDLLFFMESQCVKIQNHVAHNMKDYVEHMLDAEGIFGAEQRNREINRRLASLLRRDKVYNALSRTLPRIRRYFEGKEGAVTLSWEQKSPEEDFVRFGPDLGAQELEGALGQGRYRLSAKGIELIRMASEGVQVPEGVIIPATMDMERTMVSARQGVKALGKSIQRGDEPEAPELGSTSNPLVVSVRSGAYFVMPGQLPSIPNVGLCRATMEGFINKMSSKHGLTRSDAEWTAWDSYARFLKSYGVDILGIKEEYFERARLGVMNAYGVMLDRDLPVGDKKAIAEQYENIIRAEKGDDAVPETAEEQFERCVTAVKGSWDRSGKYRENIGIRGDWPGTAIIIQRMVFGNIKSNSGAGVVVSRMINVRQTGIDGDFLYCGQGEDIAQHRAEDLEKMQDVPDGIPWKRDLVEYAKRIDAALGTIAEIEFTVENGKLYVLQVRNAYAEEPVKDYLFMARDEFLMVKPSELIPAGGGAYRGVVLNVHGRTPDPEEIDRLYRDARGRGCDGIIAVSDDLEPNEMAKLVIKDEDGRLKIGGIITRRGSKFSHAADIARYHGMSALVNVKSVDFDEESPEKGIFRINNEYVRDGNILSISGTKGYIMHGLVPVSAGEFFRTNGRLDMTFGQFSMLLKTRGQVLSAINELVDDDIQARPDISPMACLRLIVESHREMLEARAPGVLEAINDVLDERAGIESLRYIVVAEMNKKKEEHLTAEVTEEMMNIVADTISRAEVLNKLNIEPENVLSVELMERDIDGQGGRVWFNLKVKTRTEEVPLVVVLYRDGYDLDPSLMMSGKAMASRLVRYYRDGVIEQYRSRLESAGLDVDMVEESHRDAGGDKEGAVQVLTERMKGVPYAPLASVVAAIGAENMESFYKRCDAMGDPFSLARTFFRVLEGGRYDAIKIRLSEDHPSVHDKISDVLVGGEMNGREVGPEEIREIRKEVIKTLLNTYDNRIEIYKALAKVFNLPRYHKSMSYADMKANIGMIRGTDITYARRTLLSSLLGLTGEYIVPEDIQIAFEKAGLIKRFPMDITLSDIAIVTGADGKDEIKILRWGAFFQRCTEKDLITYLKDDLGFRYSDIFDAVEELYSRQDAMSFFREAYSRENRGTTLSAAVMHRMEALKDVPNVIIGIPSDVYALFEEHDMVGSIEMRTQARIVSIRRNGRDGMIKQLMSYVDGGRSVAGLIDDTVLEVDRNDMTRSATQVTEIIGDFREKVGKDLMASIDIPVPGIDDSVIEVLGRQDITPRDIIDSGIEEKIKGVEDIHGLAGVVVKALPRGRSYDISDKSLRQIRLAQARLEKIYGEYTGNEADLRMDYPRHFTNDMTEHYVVHFSSGIGPIVVPPGLEIERRRLVQRVTKETDNNHDKFFVVAPKGSDVEDFKSEIMEMWMLDGVVDRKDVVILEERSGGYKTSDLYAMLQANAVPDVQVSPENTGFRCLGGYLDYDIIAKGLGLLQVDISPKAFSTLNQYEVLVNLILAYETGDVTEYLTTLPELEQREYKHYIYVRDAKPVDLEQEIRRYYELYRREVLIKA